MRSFSFWSAHYFRQFRKRAAFRAKSAVLSNLPQSNFVPFFATLGTFFLVTFIYDILRNSKISLLVSSQESGAEIIPFIAVWGILPAAFLLTFIYTKLSSRLSTQKVFYVMLAIFLVFFLIFATVLHPYSSFFELDSVALWLRSFLPVGMNGFIAMVQYWHFSLFFVFGELWGNIIINMVFWGFINETTAFKDAKKFYVLFALSANIAPVFSSQICLWLKQENWQDSLNIYIGIVMLAGAIISALFYILSKHKKDDLFAGRSPEKSDFSLAECFRELRNSRFLTCIAIIVLCFYVLYNLTEVLWSDQMHQRFKGDPRGMNAYLFEVSWYRGILATVVGFLVSKSIISRFGWYSAALVTPVIFAITCSVFFSLLFLGQGNSASEAISSALSMSFPALIVLVGSVQHILIRASKFSLFDATKEIAFTPLDRIAQRKGKAVIDGVGGRLGKSGGSILLQALLYSFGSLGFVVPYLGVTTIVVLAVWLIAVHYLSKEIKKIEQAAKEGNEKQY